MRHVSRARTKGGAVNNKSSHTAATKGGSTLTKHTVPFAAALAATVAFTGGAADAAGFALREGSVSALGASFSAATAGGDDITYSFWNPAALRSVEGFQLGGAVHMILPSAEGTLSGSGAVVDGSESAIVPATFMGVRLGRDVVLGVSISSPFGLATEYERGSYTSTVATFDSVPVRSALTAIEVAPMMSYDVTPTLTIAGGPAIIAGDLIFESYVSDAGGTANQELSVSDVAIGYQFGFIWEPFEGTQIGGAFHSGYSLDATGELEVTGATGALASLAGTYSGAYFGADLPALASIGITQMIGQRFRIQGEVQWQDWSALDGAVVQTALGSEIEEFNYEDAWFFAIGGEYYATDDLTLRGGVAHDATPTTDDTRSPRIPDQDRLWLSLGASYDLTEHATIDLGYSYLSATSDAPATVDNGQTLTLDAPTAHILSIGGTVDF